MRSAASIRVRSADPAGLGRLPAVVLGMVVAVVTATGIGFTLSFLLRNPIAGVVGVVALSLGEQLLTAVIPDELERYGPTASGSVLVTEGGANGFSSEWFVLAGRQPRLPGARARGDRAVRAPGGVNEVP